jgi:hypothetical protein
MAGSFWGCHTWAGFGAAGLRARDEKPGICAPQLAGGGFPVNGKCGKAATLCHIPHRHTLPVHHGCGVEGWYRLPACNALDGA